MRADQRQRVLAAAEPRVVLRRLQDHRCAVMVGPEELVRRHDAHRVDVNLLARLRVDVGVVEPRGHEHRLTWHRNAHALFASACLRPLVPTLHRDQAAALLERPLPGEARRELFAHGIEDVTADLLRLPIRARRLAVDHHDEPPLPELGEHLAVAVQPDDRHTIAGKDFVAIDLERIVGREGRVSPIELGELAVIRPTFLDLVAAAHERLNGTSTLLRWLCLFLRAKKFTLADCERYYRYLASSFVLKVFGPQDLSHISR